MDERTRLEYQSQSTALRAHLKKWEGDWVKTHNGQKPSRDDIKGVPEIGKTPCFGHEKMAISSHVLKIAQKYKEYHGLRDTLAGKIKPNSLNDAGTPGRKRKASSAARAANGIAQTPSKRQRVGETPSKTPRGSDIKGAATPSLSRKLFSPVMPTSIGPTPQRDGRVLGLFDLLGGKDAPTPSRAVAAKLAVDITPKKGVGTSNEKKDAKALGSTPISSTRYATNLLTPSHRSQPYGSSKTPRSGASSVSKLQFATPAFLRRVSQPMPTLDENTISPAATRLPRKPLFRSLSSVVAGLRKLEETTLDDDLDVLREVENEQQLGAQVRQKASSGNQIGQRAEPETAPAVVVEVRDSQLLKADTDCQRPALLGAFDDEAAFDSAEEEQLDRGQPLRVYEKRKPKRAHRLVNLKPTRTKRPATVDEVPENEKADIVPETQYDATRPFPPEEDDDSHLAISDLDSNFGSEFEGEDGKDGADNAEKPAMKSKERKGISLQTQADGKGPLRHAVRMVKATANANFRRLKLKKKTGGQGRFGGGRFGRRR
jgi:DNA replication regulator SLD2